MPLLSYFGRIARDLERALEPASRFESFVYQRDPDLRRTEASSDARLTLSFGRIDEAPGNGEAALDSFRGEGGQIRLQGRAESERCLVIADPLGGHPLYYGESSGGWLVTDDIGAALRAGLVSPEPDPVAIADHLFEPDHPSRTFLRDVFRVPPGHALLLSLGAPAQLIRYFVPPPLREPADELELAEELRSLFARAIARRVANRRGVVCELSGGLDSSSIVVMAAEGGPLPTISIRQPGSNQDEGFYIDAVEKRVERRGHHCSPFADHTWEGDDVALSSPFAGVMMGFPAYGRLLQDLGAKVLLSGFGGDQVTMEFDTLRELARRWRLRTLVEQSVLLGERPLSRMGKTMLRDALPRVLPDALRLPVARWRARWRDRRPDWATPALWASASPAVLEAPRDAAPHGRNQMFLESGSLRVSIDQMVTLYRPIGITPSFPFLDGDIVQFYQSLPLENWLPSGRIRRLLRLAMGPMLPPAVRHRANKANFAPALSDLARRSRETFQELFTGATWLSEPWVDQKAALHLFQSFVRAGRDVDRFGLVFWKLAILELWLRRLRDLRTKPH